MLVLVPALACPPPITGTGGPGGNVNVTVVTKGPCQFTITDPQTLNYDVFAASPFQDSTGSLSETCTGSHNPRVDLGHGRNGVLKGNGKYQPRMCNLPSTEFLPYNIYLDQNPQFTTIWGSTSTDGTNAGVDFGTPAATMGGTATQAVRIQIPVGVNIPPDNYTDIVRVTMTF